MLSITVSRQIGSLGDEISEQLSKTLGMDLLTRDMILSDWVGEAATSYELRMLKESPKFYLSSMKEGGSFKEYIQRRLEEHISARPSVIIGVGAHLFFSSHPGVVHLRFIASYETRLKRVKEQYGIGDAEAGGILMKIDRSHRRYISAIFGSDWADPSMYDLTVNTDNLTVEACVASISSLIREKEEALRRQPVLPELRQPEQPPAFKHPAEVEFAKILDMYQIDWVYEPRTFPVEWDAEGNVVLAFRPDFYLPKFDTYIEITTMNQKYVSTKNKKVKKLRELYPNIHIKMVYKKDFHTLLKRFGSVGEGGADGTSAD